MIVTFTARNRFTRFRMRKGTSERNERGSILKHGKMSARFKEVRRVNWISKGNSLRV